MLRAPSDRVVWDALPRERAASTADARGRVPAHPRRACWRNLLCGVSTFGGGTYTAEGITAIAEALRVNGVLTNLRLLGNSIGAAGERAVRDAVKDRSGF